MFTSLRHAHFSLFFLELLGTALPLSAFLSAAETLLNKRNGNKRVKPETPATLSDEVTYGLYAGWRRRGVMFYLAPERI